MVDFSKIRVGDEVTIRVKVTRIVSDEVLEATTGILDTWCVRNTSVATHTPAPREVKVDDTVWYVSSDYTFKVLAISGRRAWVENTSSGCDDFRTVPFDILRHAD